VDVAQQPLTSPLLDLFLELCAVPSPPGEERAVCDRIERYLDELGLGWDEDDAGAVIGSTAGNVYCRLPDGSDEGTPIFLCAHMDTVPLDGALEPVVEDGIVRNAGGTILGADNKAALAVMLEAARRVVREDRPHAGVELLFTPKEEVGLDGAAAFDHERLVARRGFVYDHEAPVGVIVLGAPHGRSLDLRFHGRAAHAGMAPEEGRSAIAAAAKAIADFRLGRLDEETSANVGVIDGGTGRNVVPEWCSVHAEARSHDERNVAELVREMLETAAFAASLCECELESDVDEGFPGYRFRVSDPVVQLATAAIRRSGLEPTYALSGGGADANVFNARGLSCLNLANGTNGIHTPDEQIAVADLEAMVDVTLALVDEARETQASASWLS
jgi:tripeptide aminopeptidase